MNECCDWHAICLNDQEVIANEETIKRAYVSYCPECNNIFECDEKGLSRIEGEKRFNYFQKYKNQISEALSK